MAGVSFKSGTRAQYDALLVKSADSLYFCTDTREIFRGADVYSDAVRFVNTYADLPQPAGAPDGVLFVCANGNGYVKRTTMAGWMQVLSGVDDKTIEHNADGLLCIKSVPQEKVSGLSAKLDSIKSAVTWNPI